ncbi:hypothetical protein GWK47_033895 [Chionoecetes opilio]|uniref:Fibronectin type-III domain-containing protein n=1 Tax=Chionoecetes opilio TaxID=41210 RepID=A0A8J4YGV1_CHIOP|nr:hypothetical protein GWK47_033895 [Chionoecetes opilio]
MFPHHGFPWSRGPRRPDHDFLWPRGFGEWGHNRPLLSQRSKVIEMCASSTTVEELDPFTKYSVAVTYDNGERNCTKNVTTKPTEPSKPKYLQVQQKPDFNDATKQSRLAIITWEAPQPRNGILKKYTFTYQLSNNESSKEHTLSGMMQFTRI